nr:SH2 domain-containing protein 2A isoform X2 [Marmota flaviventris]
MEMPLAQICPPGSYEAPAPTFSTFQTMDLTRKRCPSSGLLQEPRPQALKAEEPPPSSGTLAVHAAASSWTPETASVPGNTEKAEEVPGEDGLSLQAEILAWFQKTQAHWLLQQGTAPAWFHGFITRREAERLLGPQPQGCYLVRFSESAVTFVLTYRSRTCCRHFLLAQLRDGRHVVLGEDSAHAQLQDLLRHYTECPLSPYGETLTRPLARQGLLTLPRLPFNWSSSCLSLLSCWDYRLLSPQGCPSGLKSQTLEATVRTQAPSTTQTCNRGRLQPYRTKRGPGSPRSPLSRPGPSLPSPPNLNCPRNSTRAPPRDPAQSHPPNPPTPSTKSPRNPSPSTPWAGAALGRPPATSMPRWKVCQRRRPLGTASSASAYPGLSQEARIQVVHRGTLRILGLDKALPCLSSLHSPGGTPFPTTSLDRCFRTEDRHGSPLGLLYKCTSHSAQQAAGVKTWLGPCPGASNTETPSTGQRCCPHHVQG